MCPLILNRKRIESKGETRIAVCLICTRKCDMNRLFIIGIGMGIGTLTGDARQILSQADAVFGAARMTALVREQGLCKDGVFIADAYRPDEIFRHISDHIRTFTPNKGCDGSAEESVGSCVRCEVGKKKEDEGGGGLTYVLLVSGDTGFYSAAQGILRERDRSEREKYDRESTRDEADGCGDKARDSRDKNECKLNLPAPDDHHLEDVEIIFLPGISSVSYFFAKCGLSWQDAKLISCHGREGRLVSAVRRHHLTFALTGNNTKELGEMLCECGFAHLPVHIGEQLGSGAETITHTTVAELRKRDTASLTVLIVENSSPDSRQRAGIEDEEFVRGEVPMTKAEIRAQIMSKLCISPTDICVDVGCGTGSVTVEMALAAHEGMVYGFDISEESVELTRENIRRFQIANADIRKGRAPEVLREIFGKSDCEASESSDLKSNSKSKSQSFRFVPDVAFLGGTKGGMVEIIRYLAKLNPAIRICTTAIALESALEAIKALESLGRGVEIVQVQTARAKRVAGLHMMMAQNPIFVLSSAK